MTRRAKPTNTPAATALPKAPPLSDEALSRVAGGYIGETEKNITRSR